MVVRVYLEGNIAGMYQKSTVFYAGSIKPKEAYLIPFKLICPVCVRRVAQK